MLMPPLAAGASWAVVAAPEPAPAAAAAAAATTARCCDQRCCCCCACVLGDRRGDRRGVRPLRPRGVPCALPSSSARWRAAEAAVGAAKRPIRRECSVRRDCDEAASEAASGRRRGMERERRSGSSNCAPTRSCSCCSRAAARVCASLPACAVLRWRHCRLLSTTVTACSPPPARADTVRCRGTGPDVASPLPPAWALPAAGPAAVWRGGDTANSRLRTMRHASSVSRSLGRSTCCLRVSSACGVEDACGSRRSSCTKEMAAGDRWSAPLGLGTAPKYSMSGLPEGALVPCSPVDRWIQRLGACTCVGRAAKPRATARW